MTTSTSHRDSHEGLYARLAGICYDTRTLIADINDNLPETSDRVERKALEQALLKVQLLAHDHYRIDWQNCVSRDEFSRVDEWFKRVFLTKGWERTEGREIDWELSLVFSEDEVGDDTGHIHLSLSVTITEGERARLLAPEEFIVHPFNGESLTRAISNAQSEAWSYLRGIKRALRI